MPRNPVWQQSLGRYLRYILAERSHSRVIAIATMTPLPDEGLTWYQARTGRSANVLMDVGIWLGPRDEYPGNA